MATAPGIEWFTSINSSPKPARFWVVASFYLAKVTLHEPEFLELAPHEPERHLGAVDRHVELPEHVGQRPDVVFVAVGQDYSF